MIFLIMTTNLHVGSTQKYRSDILWTKEGYDESNSYNNHIWKFLHTNSLMSMEFLSSFYFQHEKFRNIIYFNQVVCLMRRCLVLCKIIVVKKNHASLKCNQTYATSGYKLSNFYVYIRNSCIATIHFLDYFSSLGFMQEF